MTDIAPGLADPSHDSQRLFRAVLEAFSHPGRIVALPRSADRRRTAEPRRDGVRAHPRRSRHAALARARIRCRRRARLRALPHRRADRDARGRRAVRRADARPHAAARRLRHRHRSLSRPLGDPRHRGAVAHRRGDAHGCAAPASRRAPDRPSPACPTRSGANGPPITRSSRAASTSSSPPAPSSWRCRAASSWRPEHVCGSQGRRDGDRSIRSSCWPTGAAATRDVPELSLHQIDEQLALAVDRVMTEGSLLRPRARRAGHQAGARRSGRGDLPAARLPHHPAALRRHPADRHQPHGRRAAHLRRPSRTCRAARCWARPSTTPTACSTSR